MPHDRTEPVIDQDYYTLKDRVKLTWRDVRDIATQPTTPVETSNNTNPTPALSVPDVNVKPVIEPIIERLALNKAEQTALADKLAEAIDARVKEVITQTLEISLNNALSRVRSDLERALGPNVREAVKRELQKIDWEKPL